MKARLMLASSDVGGQQESQQEKSYLQSKTRCSASQNAFTVLNVSGSLFIEEDYPSITAKKKLSSFDQGGVATSPPRPLLETTLTSRRSRGAAKSHAVCPLQRELRSGQVIKTPNLLLLVENLQVGLIFYLTASLL